LAIVRRAESGGVAVASTVDPEWYRKIWTLDVRDLSWVEATKREAEFVIAALGLQGGERVLDLACGFGRHTLELARRGFSVVGVDITADYIDEGRRKASQEGVDAEFVRADIRDVAYCEEFGVVLNLADGAVGYLENEGENLKVFDVIALALKPGGKHLLAVCNAAYAEKHFPRRHWEMGERSLSLADFAWDAENSRMVYASCALRFGEVLKRPDEQAQPAYIRLYSLDELRKILQQRGMHVVAAYGDYALETPATEEAFMLVVHSEKARA
jgi:2-polyprenyl-3-methyl-5-hydroxy-6-metoxy-1,4-benzoquinol methylase